MEGLVYVCAWKKVGNLIKVWVKNKPKLQVSAATFEAADELLADQILVAFGDGENVREYVPSPPKSPAKVQLLDLDLVTVTGNSHLPVEGDPGLLYTGGACPKCRSLLGERSTVPLTLSYGNSRYEAGFVWQAPFQFFSEAFLNLLKPKERAAFDWRPVQFKARTKKLFYELRPKQMISFVKVKGMKFDVIRCPSCQTLRGLHCFRAGTPIYHYLSAADLPKPLPSCLAIGLPTRFYLCFTRKRWRELVGQPGTRGMVSNPVGVVDESLCQRVKPG